MPIEILSFDLDDTLWPCKPTIMRAEQTLLEWMQANVPHIAGQHTVDSLREHRMHYVSQNPGIAHDLTRGRIESMRSLSADNDSGDDWVEEAFSVFYEARQLVTLFDDVSDIMDDLSQRYRLVAVSNGNADIVRTGVDHWFEFSVSAEEVGAAKPHPKVFQTVLERTGARPESIVHIGDEPHHDILGARQAGIATVWVNRKGVDWPHREFSADFQVSTFGELPAIIAGLDEPGAGS